MEKKLARVIRSCFAWKMTFNDEIRLNISYLTSTLLFGSIIRIDCNFYLEFRNRIQRQSKASILPVTSCNLLSNPTMVDLGDRLLVPQTHCKCENVSDDLS